MTVKKLIEVLKANIAAGCGDYVVGINNKEFRPLIGLSSNAPWTTVTLEFKKNRTVENLTVSRLYDILLLNIAMSNGLVTLDQYIIDEDGRKIYQLDFGPSKTMIFSLVSDEDLKRCINHDEYWSRVLFHMGIEPVDLEKAGIATDVLKAYEHYYDMYFRCSREFNWIISAWNKDQYLGDWKFKGPVDGVRTKMLIISRNDMNDIIEPEVTRDEDFGLYTLKIVTDDGTVYFARPEIMIKR